MNDWKIYPEDSLSSAGHLYCLPQAKARSRAEGRGRRPEVGIAEGCQVWDSGVQNLSEEKKENSVERGERGWTVLQPESCLVEGLLMTAFESKEASFVEHQGRHQDQN